MAKVRYRFNRRAEEADRLELSLDMKTVFRDEDLNGWLVWLAWHKKRNPRYRTPRELTLEAGRPLMVRLVKGAYWDTEVSLPNKRALKNSLYLHVSRQQMCHTMPVRTVYLSIATPFTRSLRLTMLTLRLSLSSLLVTTKKVLSSSVCMVWAIPFTIRW